MVKVLDLVEPQSLIANSVYLPHITFPDASSCELAELNLNPATWSELPVFLGLCLDMMPCNLFQTRDSLVARFKDIRDVLLEQY